VQEVGVVRSRPVVVAGAVAAGLAAVVAAWVVLSGPDTAAQIPATGATASEPDRGSPPGLADRLASPGHTALALTMDATRAVGGWLQPGDRVNVLVPSSCGDELAVRALADGDPTAETRCRRARYLYHDVEVLAAGGLLDRPEGDQVPVVGTATVVLSLPPRAAQWVATYDTDVWLTLVRRDYRPRPVPPLPAVVGDLPGENDGLLTPYCPDPGAPAPTGEGPVGCGPGAQAPAGT
jgi:hypothetical protein